MWCGNVERTLLAQGKFHCNLTLRTFICFFDRWIVGSRYPPLLGADLGIYTNRTPQIDPYFERNVRVAWKLLPYFGWSYTPLYPIYLFISKLPLYMKQMWEEGECGEEKGGGGKSTGSTDLWWSIWNHPIKFGK